MLGDCHALSEAEQTLFLSYLPLVRSIAAEVLRSRRGLDYDDLVHDGCLGLIQAICRYDPARGPFSAWFGGSENGRRPFSSSHSKGMAPFPKER